MEVSAALDDNYHGSTVTGNALESATTEEGWSGGSTSSFIDAVCAPLGNAIESFCDITIPFPTGVKALSSTARTYKCCTWECKQCLGDVPEAVARQIRAVGKKMEEEWENARDAVQEKVFDPINKAGRDLNEGFNNAVGNIGNAFSNAFEGLGRCASADLSNSMNLADSLSSFFSPRAEGRYCKLTRCRKYLSGMAALPRFRVRGARRGADG